MSLTYDRIVFFGRRLADYRRFFQLSAADLERSILDVAAGPASFAAEWAAQGGTVTALDPIYRYRPERVRQQTMWDFAHTRERAEAGRQAFRFGDVSDFEDLWQRRAEARDRFLADYPTGRALGRYRAGTLPASGLPTAAADLVLCGHFLFLYADRLDLAFHEAAIGELLRLAGQEVRLYPLVSLTGERYPYLDALRKSWDTAGVQHQIIPLEYEFLRGANEMLVLRP